MDGGRGPGLPACVANARRSTSGQRGLAPLCGRLLLLSDRPLLPSAPLRRVSYTRDWAALALCAVE
jgi:hypothetical protein